MSTKYLQNSAADKAEREKKKNSDLERACDSYELKAGMTPKFFSMLMGIKGAAKAGVPVGDKAADCIQWSRDLWAIYHTRKDTDGRTNYDFSSVGEVPYSFTEVQIEAES